MKIFNQFGLSKQLAEAIEKAGFEKPTAIQEQSIPHILAGEDVIGESATGSGKTLAFACGAIDHTTPQQGIQTLILTPTRELAEQIKQAIIQFSCNKKLTVTAIYGGVAISPQISDLTRSDIVIATPGRLLDHLQRKTIKLRAVKLLVLDEADRMLEMGFITDVEKILKACPPKRQTLFFSATMSPQIKNLAKKYLENPIEVFAENQVDVKCLKQTYYDTSQHLKLSLLVQLLKKERSALVMVFCNTRRTTDKVARILNKNNLDAQAIHGGLSQNRRTKTLEKFNTSKLTTLVCTDVASRGIHVDHVSHIYNYDLPKDPGDYVHRIGRTARAGASGKVINIITKYDTVLFKQIKRDYPKFFIKKEETPRVDIVVSAPKQRHQGGRPQRGGPSRGGPQRGGFHKGRQSRSGPPREENSRRRPSRGGPSRSGPSRGRPLRSEPSRDEHSRSGPQRGRSQRGRSQRRSNSQNRR